MTNTAGIKQNFLELIERATRANRSYANRKRKEMQILSICAIQSIVGPENRSDESPDVSLMSVEDHLTVLFRPGEDGTDVEQLTEE